MTTSGAISGLYKKVCNVTAVARGNSRGVLFAPWVATVALDALGLLDAMLAVTGIFGMAAYTVSKQLRELGIRLPLGVLFAFLMSCNLFEL